MVHALRDAWRVLEARGVLIDLRPRSTTFPIDVVADAHEIRIGEGDATATGPDDRAAEAATSAAAAERWLTPRNRTEFDIHYFWDETADMADCLRSGRRTKEVRPSYEEIDAALKETSARLGRPARLRSARRLLLSSYAKYPPA